MNYQKEQWKIIRELNDTQLLRFISLILITTLKDNELQEKCTELLKTLQKNQELIKK